LTNKLAIVFSISVLLLQLQIAPALADGQASASVQAKETTQEKQAQSDADALKSTWKVWNKTLSEEVFKRIKDKMGIGPNPDYTLRCKVSYVVTQAGKIHLLQIQGSENPAFRALVTSALESLQFSDMIKFPEGSNRSHVKKSTEYYFAYSYDNQPGPGNFDSTVISPTPANKAK
jgi:hypothetical protein